MRYIGNKTKLLPFLRKTIAKIGIPTGVVHDAFAGTAAVGRALKADGWSVHSSDLMTYSYVMQRAYVVASRAESFELLGNAVPELRNAFSRNGASRLDLVAEYLSSRIAPNNGFFAQNFGAAGGRMYFTDDNAQRIDAARSTLHGWHRDGLLSDDTFYLLLAAIIDGADRVANTAGVYAAFIKTWQPNAVRPFLLLPETPVASRAPSVAHRGDALDIARSLGKVDLIYIDPPYNTRQYAGYYHIPELLARGWFGDEVALRGKTGLIGDQTQRSAWCSRTKAPHALRELLGGTTANHALVSYNSEGVIENREMMSILREFAVDGRARRFTKLYKRYRADSDRDGRRYKGDQVREILYYARLR